MVRNTGSPQSGRMEIAQRFIAGITRKIRKQSPRSGRLKGVPMPHSYVSNLMHCVFSTKERFPFMTPELESRLWPYLGGIAREHGMKAIAIGGTADHTHVLLSLPSIMSFAKADQLIKGGSSKWIHDTFTRYGKFDW